MSKMARRIGMNADEFRDCITSYANWFPDFKAWVATLDVEVKKSWQERFEHVDKQDLLSAIEMYKSGRLPAIKQSEREQTATRLLQASQDIRRTRERREARHRARPKHDGKLPFAQSLTGSMGKAMRECERLANEEIREHGLDSIADIDKILEIRRRIGREVAEKYFRNKG